MAKETLSNWDNRFKSPAYWWCVGFGSGLLRPAPGTWGSMAGLGIGYFLLGLPNSITVILAVTILVTLVSSIAISHIETQTGVHDAPEIVIDEFAGQWLALLPLAGVDFNLIYFIAAFILFRIFDIIKPWPIGWLDKRISGGFGVMVDDLLAGIFAAIILYSGLIFGL